MLALLALNCGRVVSAAKLIDALWGDSPPSSAPKGLQVHVSNLRKKLPTGVIETVAPGYILTIDPESVDVLRFASLLEAASLETDPRARAGILSDSLSLWRGLPLQDAEEHDLGGGEARRLEEMRLDAAEQRIDALLAAGEDHSLVAELQAAVDAEPLREERWSQLMLALFRAGRRSDALRAFQQLRQYLVQEVGVEPGPSVSNLESRIIQDDISLLWVEARESTTKRALLLPGRLASASPPALLGRTTQLQEIASAVKRVVAGEGLELVLITGEPGIGKTTLLAESARQAHSLGAVALFGHGHDELRSPYQLFAEALQHYVNHADYVDLAKLRPHAASLISLVPDLKRRLPGVRTPPPSDPEAERYVLFASTLRTFETVCGQAPVILALDDLQWADEASLILLLHLITMGATMRILVVATYRSEESPHIGDGIGAIGTLRQHPKFTEIALQGFSPTEVSSFLNMAITTGSNVNESLSEALYAETDGNPLFVTEMIRQLVNRPGVLGEDSVRDDVTADLPASLADIIGSRVHRLGQGAPEILSTASVFGQAFEVDLLVQATGRSYFEVLDVLEGAARAFLVKETVDAIGRFEFAHLLIRRILYENLGVTRRAGLHGLIAQTLEDAGEASAATKAAELAGHWAQSGSKDGRRKAIAYLQRAGDDALERLAPTDAARYYTRALELNDERVDPDPFATLDLKIGIGVAWRQNGEPGSRKVLLEASREALALGDGERLIRAVLENDRGFFSAFGHLDREKVAMLEAALERAPTNSPERAMVLATYCQELTFESSLERRQELAEEALSAARASGDAMTVVRVLNRVDAPLRVPQELERSLIRSAEALEGAEAIGDAVLQFWAAASRKAAAAQAGDFDEVDRCMHITEGLALSVGQPTMLWTHTYATATRALLAGELDKAEHIAHRAFDIGSDGGEPDAFAVLASQLLSISSQRGSMGEMVPLIERALADTPALPVFWSVLAAAHAEAEHTELARPILEGACAQDYQLPVDFAWLTGMVTYAEAAIECAEPRLAEPLFDLLLPWADRFCHNDVTTEGPVSHYLGGLAWVLGRHGEAEELFHVAARMSDRIGAPCFAARTRLNWARMLLDRALPSDRALAKELLRDALDAAQRGGYGTTLRRASRLLRNR